MNGLLLINKEKDCTSRDVVNIISKCLNIKKIGHTGTLDPLATGVLVLCVGSATKLVEIITASKKEYIATIILGIHTDSYDITGNILEEKKAIFNKKEIELALKKMIGTYNQEVPIYSAVKVKGKKLYEYARENKEVILPKKEVTIDSLKLIDNITYENDKTIFKVKCCVSKGTYIRSLIVDLASKLDTIGIMANLDRTKQGIFNISECCTVEDVKNNNYKLLDIETCLKDIYTVVVDNYIENKIKNGCLLENRYSEDIILFKNENNSLLAIYKIYEKDNSKIKPWKML